jgi:signal transduction histidine kinase
LELRPSALENITIGELLRQLADGFSGRTQASLELSINDQEALPFEVRVTFFRLAQEALNNIIKHARARQVWVNFDNEAGQVRLTIKDDGRGFDLDSQSAGHHGLTIMRERTQSIGATLDIQSSPGDGTLIEVVWQKEQVTL